MFYLGMKDGVLYQRAHHHRWVTYHFLFQKEIDAEQEVIQLCTTEPTEIKDLPVRIPKDSPRYHFFLYKHSHEGDYLESTGDS